MPAAIICRRYRTHSPLAAGKMYGMALQPAVTSRNALSARNRTGFMSLVVTVPDIQQYSTCQICTVSTKQNRIYEFGILTVPDIQQYSTCQICTVSTEQNRIYEFGSDSAGYTYNSTVLIRYALSARNRTGFMRLV